MTPLSYSLLYTKVFICQQLFFNFLILFYLMILRISTKSKKTVSDTRCLSMPVFQFSKNNSALYSLFLKIHFLVVIHHIFCKLCGIFDMLCRCCDPKNRFVLTDRPSDDISDCHLNKYRNYILSYHWLFVSEASVFVLFKISSPVILRLELVFFHHSFL